VCICVIYSLSGQSFLCRGAEKERRTKKNQRTAANVPRLSAFRYSSMPTFFPQGCHESRMATEPFVAHLDPPISVGRYIRMYLSKSCDMYIGWLNMPMHTYIYPVWKVDGQTQPVSRAAFFLQGGRSDDVEGNET